MSRKLNDFVRQSDKHRSSLFEFFLDMTSWKKFKTKYTFAWKKIQFDPANRANVPATRGVYAFTIEASSAKLPAHGYIMYVGITGDRSNADLQSRFGNYLAEQRTLRRPRVHYMLNRWTEDLFFNYVEVPNTTVDLGRIETALLNAVRPPVNQRDFDAEISKVRKAAF